MKRKEILQLIVALAVLVIAGYFIFIQVSPKKGNTKKSTATVEVITPVPASYDQDEIDALGDNTKYRDFYVQPDLKSGLNNNQPFGSQ